MICYIEKSLEAVLLYLSFDDPFFCKIMSLYSAYSYNSGCVDFYIQFNTRKDITAVISRLDQTAVCYIEPLADFEELEDFLKTIGVKTIALNRKYISNFSYKGLFEGSIMKLDKLNTPRNIDKRFLVKEPSTKELLDFYSNNFSYVVSRDRYANVYVDLSHRLRHNAIKAIAAFYDGCIIGSAMMIISSAKEAAILGPVATDIKYRKNGIASFLIYEILKDYIGKKNIYLFREQGKNKEFYYNLGFYNEERWAEIKI